MKNSSLKTYKHLFFDLDRTLWDLDRNSREALLEIYTHFKLEELGVINFEAFFENYKHINHRLWDDYRKGLIHKDSLRTIRFSQTLQLFQIFDPRLSEQIGYTYVEISPKKTNLLPNALSTLEYLAPHYQIHIITNGFEEVQHIKLENSGLKPYLSHIITSEKAQCKKPDPRIFAFALHETGAKRNESLMIGDSLELDIIGAKQVGISQVYFNPEGIKHSVEITHEIRNLQELQNIL
ncbi:MAG: YjjG family noncanonical pyrimidine nucleotidase [Bacteroidia bacterium]|nr:YjjG family noncanonical pyrimidine nucleotidase [Bacteroidia bacterium]